MNILSYLTENNTPEEVKPITIVLLAILFCIVLGAWVFVFIKFLVLRKLRIRFFLPNGKVFKTVYLKKGEFMPVVDDAPDIDGFDYLGLYLDTTFSEEYIPSPMVDKNLKVYAKYQNIETKEIWQYK